MRRAPQPAADEIIVGTRLVPFEEGADRPAGVFGDFELDRATRLLLDDSAASPHFAARGDIANLQPDEVAAPKLAVDSKIEQGEIANVSVEFEPGTDRPDFLHFQGWLLAGQLARSDMRLLR